MKFLDSSLSQKQYICKCFCWAPSCTLQWLKTNILHVLTKKVLPFRNSESHIGTSESSHGSNTTGFFCHWPWIKHGRILRGGAPNQIAGDDQSATENANAQNRLGELQMVTWSLTAYSKDLKASSTSPQSWKDVYAIRMSDYHRSSFIILCEAFLNQKREKKHWKTSICWKDLLANIAGLLGTHNVELPGALGLIYGIKTSPSRLSKYVARLRWWCSECRKFGTSQQPGVATEEQMVARSASTAFGQCRFFSFASHANHINMSAHPTTSNMYCTYRHDLQEAASTNPQVVPELNTGSLVWPFYLLFSLESLKDSTLELGHFLHTRMPDDACTILHHVLRSRNLHIQVTLLRVHSISWATEVNKLLTWPPLAFRHQCYEKHICSW